jgi:MFS-type transporter involved in bile tolerance (Atg22 family)
MPTSPTARDRVPLAIGLDVFAVVLFVALGRRSHDESGAFAAVVETAAPFLVGLAAGWLIARAWRRPTSLLTGIVIWPVTIIVGMVVRNLVFDRGTATSFVIVATLFVGAFLVGWRLAVRLVDRRRAHPSRHAVTAR